MKLDFKAPIDEADFQVTKPSCLHDCYLCMQLTIYCKGKVTIYHQGKGEQEETISLCLYNKSCMDLVRNISAEKKGCSIESRLKQEKMHWLGTIQLNLDDTIQKAVPESSYKRLHRKVFPKLEIHHASQIRNRIPNITFFPPFFMLGRFRISIYLSIQDVVNLVVV